MPPKIVLLKPSYSKTGTQTGPGTGNGHKGSNQ